MSAPDTAMVLAAGLGLRMRPITETLPKPLVRVAGKALLDWGLDSLAEAGVDKAVVNVHHLADQIVAHVATRTRPCVVISNESEGLLDSAGGIVNALAELGPEPFFIVNADTFWIDRATPNLRRLADAWDPVRMDIILMLARPGQATGHTGGLDFLLDGDGRLSRAASASDGFIYAGAGILHPRLFEEARAERHSLNAYFDRSIQTGRLFGLPLDGHWITVGTPGAIPLAAEAVTRARAERA